MDEESVKHAVLTGETALRDCWAKLILLQSTGVSKKEFLTTLLSFQPTLLAALVEIESCYNEICKAQRNLVSKRQSVKSKLFSEEKQKLEHFKHVLNGVINIGKTLGDAFAWIFYQRNRPLLQKHYEHEFIPRLPTRLGGRGEVEFVRNHPMFGQYFV